MSPFGPISQLAFQNRYTTKGRLDGFGLEHFVLWLCYHRARYVGSEHGRRLATELFHR
jgi:hypothetical protein